MKTKTIFILLLAFISLTVNAQHDHGGHGHTDDAHTHKIKPPHGGEIRDIGKYHIEIVFDKMSAKDQFKIYLLNSNLKTLAWSNASATIKLAYKNGNETTLTFINQSEFMVANLADAINAFEAIISITYKDKTHTLVYTYNGL
ncbi:MAG: hypothetical protein ACOZCO_07140 [Bacteroidota bacterium]